MEIPKGYYRTSFRNTSLLLPFGQHSPFAVSSPQFLGVALASSRFSRSFRIRSLAASFAFLKSLHTRPLAASFALSQPSRAQSLAAAIAISRSSMQPPLGGVRLSQSPYTPLLVAAFAFSKLFRARWFMAAVAFSQSLRTWPPLGSIRSFTVFPRPARNRSFAFS